MNNLNSVLIEGIATSNAKFESEGVCRFSIKSNRFHNNDGEIEKEVTPITVEVQGKLAETCKLMIHKGRGLRAVGSLKQISKYYSGHKIFVPQLIIMAEHVEFKPELENQELFTEVENAQ
jgi:single-strand DNA-binding protein